MNSEEEKNKGEGRTQKIGWRRGKSFILKILLRECDLSFKQKRLFL